MKKDWKLDDFDYALPSGLIAQQPLLDRHASRLLYVDARTADLAHGAVAQWIDSLTSQDLLIFNNTKVIPARLYGYKKETGGKIECLVERLQDVKHMWAHLRASKAPKVGSLLRLANAFDAKIIDRQNNLYCLAVESDQSLLNLLHAYGEIPLPPYIDRKPIKIDSERYQTVFAQIEGAVAAPTAGLHFDAEFFDKLKEKGIAFEFVTLHVGAGTFQPVRTTTIAEHQMHEEYMELTAPVCDAVLRCKKRGGRVIAVGTTVVRSLESAAQSGIIKPYVGGTRLFIYPGYQFHCVDAIFTNFHLPKSSLLMLVAAFGGYELIMRAYREAVKEKYRFFSYGDAMFILPSDDR